MPIARLPNLRFTHADTEFLLEYIVRVCLSDDDAELQFSLLTYSMHISAPTDEFRTAAEAVRITVQEMRLMEREKGIWRLPATLREEKPQLYSLLNMYNKTMVCDTVWHFDFHH